MTSMRCNTAIVYCTLQIVSYAFGNQRNFAHIEKKNAKIYFCTLTMQPCNKTLIHSRVQKFFVRMQDSIVREQKDFVRVQTSIVREQKDFVRVQVAIVRKKLFHETAQIINVSMHGLKVR